MATNRAHRIAHTAYAGCCCLGNCWSVLLLCGLLLGGLCADGFAQENPPGDAREREGRDREEGGGREGFRREGFRGSGRRGGFSMESLDANGDGLLQENELPERMRDRFHEMGERAGVKPGEPIPLEALRRSRERSEEESRDRPRDDSPGSGAADKSAASPPVAGAETSASASTVEPMKATAVAPLVPGFGVESKLPPVPGFGEPLTAAKGTPGTTAKAAAGDAPSPEALERVQRYALSLMRQYDLNKNEILEPNEWKEMRGDPAQADTNKDGYITLEELTQRLASYGRRRDGDSRRNESSGNGGEANRPASSEATPAEPGKAASASSAKRLPEGLPSWFATKDKNGDSQVSMAEYSTSWSDTLAAEFRRWDTNDDGIITPRECLAVQKSSGAAAAK